MKGVIFMAVKAQGAPTKEFFVGMLTRDIELSDAILDLLDNCLDGVVRQKKGIDKTTTSDLNCTPFVRQYGILSNKWGVLLCQKEYQTNDIRRNSKNW